MRQKTIARTIKVRQQACRRGVIDFYCKKNLDFCIDIFKSIITFAVANANRGVAQLAARHVRDVEVGSSSLLTPTEIRLILSSGFFVFSQCHRHGATSRHGARRRNKKIGNRLLLTDSRLCDPDGIQTHNLLIRSQMLYSVKLRGHFFDGKDTNNFRSATNSGYFFRDFFKKNFRRKAADRCNRMASCGFK